jgi:hypothetical protein
VGETVLEVDVKFLDFDDVFVLQKLAKLVCFSDGRDDFGIACPEDFDGELLGKIRIQERRVSSVILLDSELDDGMRS